MRRFTRESVIFRNHLSEVDMGVPISVLRDVNGDELVADGNHRAFRSEMTGEKLKVRVIGTYRGSLAAELDIRPVSELKPIDARYPFGN